MTKNEIFKTSCKSCECFDITPARVKAVADRRQRNYAEFIKDIVLSLQVRHDAKKLLFDVVNGLDLAEVNPRDTMIAVLCASNQDPFRSADFSEVITEALYILAINGYCVHYFGTTENAYKTLVDRLDNLSTHTKKSVGGLVDSLFSFWKGEDATVSEEQTTDSGTKMVDSIATEPVDGELAGLMTAILRSSDMNTLAQCFIEAVPLAPEAGLKENTESALHIALSYVERSKGIIKNRPVSKS